MRIVLYTGQEFDQEYHLYNYNARLYDPIMARFITADTIVPDWTNPQSLNRYSYVLNNPLKYVDPSGHLFVIDDILVGMAIGALLGGAMAAVTGGNILEGMLAGAISGACFGAVHGLAAAGSITQAGLHAAAGSISGGINAAITGGNVLQGMGIGAFSGFLGTYAGGVLGKSDWYQSLGSQTSRNAAEFATRIGIGAVVGGVSAEVAGGTFADGAFHGAWTSAFAMILNDNLKKFFGDPMKEIGPKGAYKGAGRGTKADALGIGNHFSQYKHDGDIFREIGKQAYQLELDICRGTQVRGRIMYDKPYPWPRTIKVFPHEIYINEKKHGKYWIDLNGRKDCTN